MQNRATHWEILDERYVYKAPPWIQVSVQQVRLPDGQIIDDYHQIQLPEYVVVFAQTSAGDVIVERAYKHGAGKVCLNLPAGLIEAGETPLETAQRELLEETGYVSDEWRPLGSFVQHGNYGCGKAHLFAAKSARRVAQADSGDLGEAEILLLRPAEIVNAFKTGQVALLGIATAFALATNPLFSSE